MFFIPFLGAAVTGEREDATPMQQIIVSLLGPVPGLIVGGACLYWAPESGESVLTQIGLTALSLNYLNLLPVNPLDGGRVVDVLLSRFPWIRFAFGLISVVVLLLAGLSGSSLMLGIAVAMMFALAAQWRMNIALRRMRNLTAALTSRQERLQAIFQVLTQAPFCQQQAAARYELAKSLLRYLTTGPTNWRTMFIGGAVYAAALFVPVYIGVKASMATVREHVAAMDTHCFPLSHNANVPSLQDILAEKDQPTNLTVHKIAGHVRTKAPCVAESKTYDLAQLNADERLFWDLYWFDLKLSLGGFRQLFENDGTKAAKLLAELEQVGAAHSKGLLEQSLEAFPDKRIPETQEKVCEVLRQIDEDREHPAHALWEKLEEEFAENHANEVDEHLLSYVRQHVSNFLSQQTLAQVAKESTTTPPVTAVKPESEQAAAAKPIKKKIAVAHDLEGFTRNQVVHW